MSTCLSKSTILLAAIAAIAPGLASAVDAPKKGNRTFNIHYVYNPVGYSEVPGVGKITVLESAGQFENIKGDSAPFKDALKSKCQMVSIEAVGKTWTEGACVISDADGDLTFATFDSRNLDKSQQHLNCGSYVSSGGTGKFKGYSASGAYSCGAIAEAPKGSPAGSFSIDVNHNENWQMN